MQGGKRTDTIIVLWWLTIDYEWTIKQGFVESTESSCRVARYACRKKAQSKTQTLPLFKSKRIYEITHFHLYIHYILYKTPELNKYEILSYLSITKRARSIGIYIILCITRCIHNVLHVVIFLKLITRKWVNNNKMLWCYVNVKVTQSMQNIEDLASLPAVAVTLLSTGCRWCPSEQTPPNVQTLLFFLNLPKRVCFIVVYLLRVSRFSARGLNPTEWSDAPAKLTNRILKGPVTRTAEDRSARASSFGVHATFCAVRIGQDRWDLTLRWSSAQMPDRTRWMTSNRHWFVIFTVVIECPFRAAFLRRRRWCCWRLRQNVNLARFYISDTVQSVF